MMTEQSIKRLTKAHLIDLKNMVKPHFLIEKVLHMVCILKGCIAPSWTLARELLSSMTFKLELVLLDPTRIKQTLIKKVIRILN
jgi:hypoxanthine-guanine phosphoribosyltransferase